MKFMKKKDNIENSNNNKEKDKEKDKKDKDKEKEKEIKENEKKEKKEKKNNTSKRKNEDIDNHSNNNKKVFGGSLPFLFEEELPSILVQTIEYLESNGLETPGIFRENGSLASIQNYRALYDSEKTVNFPPHEAHVVASLLKAYLRELKDPLCTFEHYDMFIACESIADEKVKVELLKKVIAHLPPYNRKVMKYIFSFLLKVVENSAINKMAPDALSVVFLPTILRPKANTDLEILQFTVEDSKSTKTLMSSILLNYEEIFEDPSLFQPRTRQTRAHTEFVSPPSSQNSTSSILSSTKNTPRSPIPSPNFSTSSLLSALPPPPLSPLLTPITTTTVAPPPLISSSIDDNNQTSLSKPSLSSTSAPSISQLQHPPTTTTTTTASTMIPPPLPDKKLCKLLPNNGETTTPTTISPSQMSPTLSSTVDNTTTLPLPIISTLELPPTLNTTENQTSLPPISPTKNLNTLPTLPPKPPSLVLPTLPPKPIPKIPNMFEFENNGTRQRSNTTMV